jgi:hypothetical protein
MIAPSNTISVVVALIFSHPLLPFDDFEVVIGIHNFKGINACTADW